MIAGLNFLPADRYMPLKKRNQALQIGGDYYIHRKTYKRLCKLSRQGKDLRPVLERIKVKHRVHSAALSFFTPSESLCSFLFR